MRKIIYNVVLTIFTVSSVFSQTEITRYGKRMDTTRDTTNLLQSSTKNKSVPTPEIMSISPVISFEEFPINHNEHITSDGKYYYTINGGYYLWGQINKFRLNGTLIKTYPILIDGRGLSYNQADGLLYASLYEGDIVKITDLESGSFTTKFTHIMQNDQASFAISPDGSKFFDFYAGTLKIHDFNTGAVIKTITGLSYGAGNFGGDAAVAVDRNHIYTWDATIRTVYVYDRSGNFMQSLLLNKGDNGMSLSIANGLLFVSKDGNYDIGEWYGYCLKSHLANSFISSSFSADIQLNKKELEISSKLKISNTPNPFSTTTRIFYDLPLNGKVSLKVFDPLGREVATLVNAQQQAGSYKVDFTASGTLNALYYYRIILTTDKQVYDKVGKMVVVK
jgi:hypothetical protein